MMLPIQSYVRIGRHTLRKWFLDPRLHTALRATAYLLSGFVLSAASLENSVLPLAVGLVCVCKGWSGVLATAGSCIGYMLFWGSAGIQGVVWSLAALSFSPLCRLSASTRAFTCAFTGLVVAVSGVIFQIWGGDTTPVPVYLLKILLAAGSAWLFLSVLGGRNPLGEWLTCAVAVLSLAQIMPIPYFGLGYIAAGCLAVTGAFPAVALSGLALDLAQITPVPMTAVLCCSYLIRFLPRYPRLAGCAAPAVTYVLIMSLCNQWDLFPLAGLFTGGLISILLPAPTKLAHRRGETGSVQVKLEIAAGVLAQTEQLLLEINIVPVDESALVARAAERACNSCPCRKSCKDTRRIAQLPSPILHKPLLSIEELPITCRKSGRFLAELHRSQEQLRSIRADRERQQEYRAAVVQQYRFLSRFLQDLSDQLSRRGDNRRVIYKPLISVYGNQPENTNGDRCISFSGVSCRYYVLLCDGMGTGSGALWEAQTAAGLLKRLLSAGYPAEYALRSMNSLCALRDRAGAVTVDLAELSLDTGKVTIYKWGAAPSYIVSSMGTLAGRRCQL